MDIGLGGVGNVLRYFEIVVMECHRAVVNLHQPV